MLAAFDQACDLVIPDARVVALVTPRVGAGPLNVVVKAPAVRCEGLICLADVAVGTPATLTAREIRIGRLTLSLQEATTWEPRPDWQSLRGSHPTIATNLPVLREHCRQRPANGSLLWLLETGSNQLPAPASTLTEAQSALRPLAAGWTGDASRLREGATRMAGLGIGLTPSGDDFLTGLMLWAWLEHPTPGPLCHAIAETAARDTTTRSAAFLRAAARGECSAAWHALLTGLVGTEPAPIVQAADDILCHGATSGADALAGFLWAGSMFPRFPSSASRDRSFPPRAAGR